MPKAEAEAKGAIAFFGDKYGEHVRVVHAGQRSVELCGGTHVDRLGMIGPLEVVSESSIGSNLRRVEALTGTATLERLRSNEARLAHAASLLKAAPEELSAAIERRLAELERLQEELKSARQADLRARRPPWLPLLRAGLWWPDATASAPTSCASWRWRCVPTRE